MYKKKQTRWRDKLPWKKQRQPQTTKQFAARIKLHRIKTATLQCGLRPVDCRAWSAVVLLRVLTLAGVTCG
jgi:hypothetical protein